ncbi:restriction endonuclease subunit S [Streptomyces sp. WI03-4A]|uniref:restriction endonuclease subunit S n=1 Tax=Streptomyces sp. WI03-4A TaxID=3028706 RepID=UPI0029A0FA54|nr:restriction endonuclease subunit S [Streptomyces sp. WI03-4A]MDX2591796.1 restriction endonuclease subunit S [Streptomyces sp. WI03-4A]
MIWPRATVSELCSAVTSGGTPRRSNPAYYTPKGIPWVKTQELNDGRLEDAAEHISAQAIQESSAKLLPAGTILVAMYGATAGKLGVLGRPMACNQACCALVVKPGAADPRFLFYALLNSREELKGLANGAAQQNLSVRVIKEFRIPNPSLEVQQRAGSLLGALDDKVAVNERIVGTCRDLAGALFQQATVSPGSRTVPLSELAVHKPGKYLSKDAYAAGGPYAVYGSNSVMGWHSACLYEGRFAVLARIGSNCGSVRWSNSPAWVNNNASAIIPKDSRDALLLRHALDTVDMAPHRSGSAQPFIRVDSLMATDVTVPAASDHGRVTAQLEALARREAVAGPESRQLAQLRDTLLPQLMSGRLRVKDAEKIVEDAT